MKNLPKGKRTLPGPVPPLHQPPVYRPNPPRPPVRLPAQPGVQPPIQPKMRQAPLPPAPRREHRPAPPVYRPQISPALQRMEQFKGFPGFYSGDLSASQQKGTFNTTWSQTQTPPSHETVSHSSAKLSKFASSQLVEFAGVEHLEDEENTHAEDKLAAYVHQRVAEAGQTGIVLLTIPEFFVSASPCSSAFGTSGKSTGCTENLIAWHETGLILQPDFGCTVTARITITRLVVHHLYKGNTYEGAEGSYAALRRLKSKGVIGAWHIQNMPGLKDFRGSQDG